jgi:chaperone modulatory protein CbpM
MSGNRFEVEIIDALWIEPPQVARDAQRAWTLAALAESCGVASNEVRELVEYGALHPDNPDVDADRWMFSARCAVTIRTAVRLRRDFDLDTPGLALALTLIERIRALEDDLRRVRAETPR